MLFDPTQNRSNLNYIAGSSTKCLGHESINTTDIKKNAFKNVYKHFTLSRPTLFGVVSCP